MTNGAVPRQDCGSRPASDTANEPSTASVGPAGAIEVHAPSRLHFGLFSFGSPAQRCYGGIGAMISQPGLRVRVSRASCFEVTGPLAARARRVADDLARLGRLPVELPCRIEIPEAPPEHHGLGTGTQLTLAVATALLRWFDRPHVDPSTLAVELGRARRSAIGTHGFAHGGLLLDGGLPSARIEQREIAPLIARVALPNNWRFVLFAPRDETGLSGTDERAAFERLPPVPREVTAELCREALLGLVPAAVDADYETFSECLYRFGRLAGSCYTAVQGGPYGSARLERLVEQARELGAPGVAQSSWGPTLFALLPDQTTAERFAQRLAALPSGSTLTTTVAAAGNAGAQLVELP
ncbi:MAG: hypothetical protein K2Y37_01805 [Pirellulales bacterium]|nr:hypothetical protein [Pirellulales bacterium]